MSRFVLQGDVAQNGFDWGDIGWRCTPALAGATMFAVMDVTLGPGMAHDFHTHPDQDEMIIVTTGRVEPWIERDSRQLGPGDSVDVDAGVVHGPFNVA